MFFFQAEDGIRDLVRSRGLGDVYKRQSLGSVSFPHAEKGRGVAQEHWQNDLYEQLALGSAAQTNPIAASLLESLDDQRFKALRDTVLDEAHLYPGAVALEIGCGPGTVSYTHLTLPTSDLV